MTKKESSKISYGPENPHPLSWMKTELVWEGKYDEFGKRRPVKLPTSPFPLVHRQRLWQWGFGVS